MKKIVALVLSLVMALSLCTVAFAYDTGDEFYDALTDGKGNTYVYTAASSTYKVGDASYNKVATLHVTAGPDIGKWYFVVEKDGKALYEEGNTVASIQRGDEFTDNSGEYYHYTATAVDAEKWSCTTDKHNAGYKYEDAKGNTVYAEKVDGGSIKLLVDGKIVKVENQAAKDVAPGQHVLVVPKTGAKELDVGVYEAYCAACHKTLKYTDKNISGAGALYDLDTADWIVKNGTVAIPNGYELLKVKTGVYVIGENDTKADDTKKDGIDSAKTFDAGVAMYVGMSLLSVAGGAVVIGKKKEF